MAQLRPLFFCLYLFVFVPASVRSADLSPYLDPETIAVIKVNVKQLKLPEIVKYYETAFLKAINEVVPGNDPAAPLLKQLIRETALMAPPEMYEDMIVGYKLEEIYAIVYRDAIMRQTYPVLLAIPVPEGASQDQIDLIRMLYLHWQIPVTFVRHGFIVGIPVLEQFAGQQQVMAFAREKFREPSSRSRPEIVAALDSQPDAAFQVVVGRIDQFQRDVETQLNTLKMLLLTMPGEQQEELNQALKMVPVIFQNLNSLSFSYDYDKPEIKQVIQLRDEQTARTVLTMTLEQRKKAEEMLAQVPIVSHVLAINAQNPGMTREGLAATKELLQAVQIRQQGNDVVTLLDPSGMTRLESLVYEMVIKSAVAGMHAGFNIGARMR